MNRLWNHRWRECLGFALFGLLLACSGGGPGGAGGPSGGGALDNYAAGPVSLPAPTMLNKGLIVCENVAGPTVECRGTSGAAPANARIKLTVYARLAQAQPSWTDLLLPSARALAGSTDFCNAKADGSFGQTPGDCSVLASTGEKIGICVASGNTCVGSELVIIVPVEGATASGASGTIKSLSVDPNGYIIFGRVQPQELKSRRSFDWTSLFLATAHAEGPPVPTLTPAAPTAAQCAIKPPVDLATRYAAPDADSFVTFRQKSGGLAPTELFRIAGSQDDLKAVRAGHIGNPNFISFALKNTVYIFGRESLAPVAQIVFPAPIRALVGGLDVLLEVPKGDPSLYHVASDSFVTTCDQGPESTGLTNPNSFATGTGEYTPPGDGYRVPQPFHISTGVGEQVGTSEYHVVFGQDAVGDIPAWNGMLYHQAALLKDVAILKVTPTWAAVAVLDPGANRLLFITRHLVSGELNVTPVSLQRVTISPVAMKFINADANPRLLLLDSFETGAKVVLIPVLIDDAGAVRLALDGLTSKSLGAIVANVLEPFNEDLGDWLTYDLTTSNIVNFNLRSFTSPTVSLPDLGGVTPPIPGANPELPPAP